VRLFVLENWDYLIANLAFGGGKGGFWHKKHNLAAETLFWG
jgi:hypothetical protein